MAVMPAAVDSNPGPAVAAGGGSSFLDVSTRVGSIVGGVSRADGLVVIAAAQAGVPTAPTVLQVSGRPLKATVSFTPPSDDGGSAITSYTVTSIPEGHTATEQPVP